MAATGVPRAVTSDFHSWRSRASRRSDCTPAPSQHAVVPELGIFPFFLFPIFFGLTARVIPLRSGLRVFCFVGSALNNIGLELADSDRLSRSYGSQAEVYEAWGRLDEALDLLKKQENLELDNKNRLQASYRRQAPILIKQRKLGEAEALYRKVETICSELGNKSGLGHCFWESAALEAARGDRAVQKQRLEQALTIFKQLGTPVSRDAVQVELAQLTSTD